MTLHVPLQEYFKKENQKDFLFLLVCSKAHQLLNSEVLVLKEGQEIIDLCVSL